MSKENCQGHSVYDPFSGLDRGQDLLRAGRRIADALSWAVASLLILVIGFYRSLVSPVTGPACRFHPTCSTYAVEAIKLYGPLGGTARAVARILRCQPFCRSGYDPVH